MLGKVSLWPYLGCQSKSSAKKRAAEARSTWCGNSGALDSVLDFEMRKREREREGERERELRSRVLTFVSWRTGCRALRWRPSGSTWGCASLRPSPQAPPGTARGTCLRTKQSLQKRRSFFCTARATRERERRWPSGRARCCQQAFAFVFFFLRAAANERAFRN